jgi:hypothetical protein
MNSHWSDRLRLLNQHGTLPFPPQLGFLTEDRRVIACGPPGATPISAVPHLSLVRKPG